MENFEDFENKSYVRARRVKYNFSDHAIFMMNFAKIVVQITALVITEIFLNLIKLFQSEKPKNISGQLALVTGLDDFFKQKTTGLIKNV